MQSSGHKEHRDDLSASSLSKQVCVCVYDPFLSVVVTVFTGVHKLLTVWG